jgi:parallel beta-helix repeat protein
MKIVLAALSYGAVVALPVFPVSAAVRLVPTGYATIQDALDAAVESDEVVVEPGTYHENVVVPDFSITLRSQSDDPTDTILDGTGNLAEPAMVYFQGDSAGVRVLRGFTLTHSEAHAVDVQDILFTPDHHSVENCRFIDNGPETALHGGFGSLDILDCEFIDNVGNVFGGGALIRGPGLISGNLFRNNQAMPDTVYSETQGGGLFLSSTYPTGRLVEIRNNVFEDNYCNDYGGGLYIFQDYDVVVEDNIFRRNVADICAGGIYVVGNVDSVVIQNNLLDGNASLLGGTFAIDLGSDGTVLRNNTVVNNMGGAGILVHNSTNILLENNIVAFGDSWGIRWLVDGGSTISGTMTCNDVFDNPMGDIVGMTPDMTNISQNPLFCSSGAGDYTLAAGSPCLAANNACGVLMGARGQGCQEVSGIPTDPPPVVVLSQNAPNPFIPPTAIRYAVTRAGMVSLRVYDAAGRPVRTLVQETQAPRAEGYTVSWDGRDDAGIPAPGGIYFYRLVTPASSAAKKMFLLQ